MTEVADAVSERVSERSTGKLAGQVAVVTGAGSGMGAETAVLLAEEGARVMLIGRREDALEGVRRRIVSAGGEAAVFPADVTDAASIPPLIDRIRAEHGPIDILVNNAGSSSRIRNPQWMSDEVWDDVIELNLNAVFRLTRTVLPDMLERKRGTIVTVSSLSALNPDLLGGAPYSAAKAGVRNFMGFLHATYRNEGLRAVTVIPGEADTAILDGRPNPPAAGDREWMLHPADIAEDIRLAVTLPQRAVLPEIVVAPTRQRDTSADLEANRWEGAPAELLRG